MPFIRIFSAIIQMTGIFLTVFVFAFEIITGRSKTKNGKIFISLLACNFFHILFDFLALVLRYRDGEAALRATKLLNYLAFVFGFVLAALFFTFFSQFVSSKVKISKALNYTVYSVTLVSLILLVINIFYPIYFDFTPEYTRAKWFVLANLPVATEVLFCTYILIKYRSKFESYEKLAMSVYLILPVASVIIQSLFYGLSLVSLANSISCAVVCLILQLEREKEIAEKDKKIAELDREAVLNQVNISISQLQPHFLYNSLNAIQYLCQTDPVLADEIIGTFAKYLRMNMDSLTQKKPIDFDRDLEHLENYLSIEKLRFPKISFIYDIRERNFKVPPLTLQPLVENAVKYGVRTNKKDGYVKISTYKHDDSYYIEIKDNGCGFDINKIYEDNKSHIGIYNTRSRLQAMCGGKLEIQSEIGKGTTVMITIPKDMKG